MVEVSALVLVQGLVENLLRNWETNALLFSEVLQIYYWAHQIWVLSVSVLRFNQILAEFVNDLLVNFWRKVKVMVKYGQSCVSLIPLGF